MLQTRTARNVSGKSDRDSGRNADNSSIRFCLAKDGMSNILLLENVTALMR